MDIYQNIRILLQEGYIKKTCIKFFNIANQPE